MTDTTHEAPERIWITSDGIWYDFDPSEACDPVGEYVRADLVQAAVAAALREAAAHIAPHPDNARS